MTAYGSMTSREVATALDAAWKANVSKGKSYVAESLKAQLDAKVRTAAYEAHAWLIGYHYG